MSGRRPVREQLGTYRVGLAVVTTAVTLDATDADHALEQALDALRQASEADYVLTNVTLEVVAEPTVRVTTDLETTSGGRSL